MIKSLTVNQTPQDVCATLSWPVGGVVTVQNKSTSTLRVTQAQKQPASDTQDYVCLMPYQSLTTQKGDDTLWIWSPSEAIIALIKRS